MKDEETYTEYTGTVTFLVRKKQVSVNVSDRMMKQNLMEPEDAILLEVADWISAMPSRYMKATDIKAGKRHVGDPLKKQSAGGYRPMDEEGEE